MISEPYVLIVSTLADIATDEVIKRLSLRGVPLLRINTEEYPFDSTLAFRPADARPDAWFNVNGDWLPEPHSIWYRRIRVPARPHAVDPGVYEFSLRETRAALLGGLLHSNSRWMSHPTMMWQAEFKPFQLAVAKRLGFRVPRTLVTNDPTQVRHAYNTLKRMIVKPAYSGHVVNDGKEFAIFTSELLDEHLHDVESVRWSPAIYQELIEKKYDVRVVVVGTEVFAAFIDSQSDPSATIDWRKTRQANLPHFRATLPQGLSDRLRELMRELRISFGAIDLVQMPSGDFVFLEVNPAGQWLWLDDRLDLGISNAVADWLSPKV